MQSHSLELHPNMKLSIQTKITKKNLKYHSIPDVKSSTQSHFSDLQNAYSDRMFKLP